MSRSKRTRNSKYWHAITWPDGKITVIVIAKSSEAALSVFCTYYGIREISGKRLKIEPLGLYDGDEPPSFESCYPLLSDILEEGE